MRAMIVRHSSSRRDAIFCSLPMQNASAFASRAMVA
jgi:hypothetical protein